MIVHYNIQEYLSSFEVCALRFCVKRAYIDWDRRIQPSDNECKCNEKSMCEIETILQLNDKMMKLNFLERC